MADPSSPKSEPEIDWNRARVMLRARISSLLGRSDPVTEDLTQEALVDLLRVVRREGWRGSDGLLTVIAQTGHAPNGFVPHARVEVDDDTITAHVDVA